jgi:hypothetical protein
MWKAFAFLSVLCVTVGCSRGQTDGAGASAGSGTKVNPALSSKECTQLGGTVSDAALCGGTGKICTTYTVNPVTKLPESHQLCIDKSE